MCGVFFYNKNNNLNLSNEVFLNGLKHRGPDFQKVYEDQSVKIGHTLLSIRDSIENSIQPVITNNDRYVISFNGQIYNLNEIKKKFKLPNNIVLDTSIISILCNLIGVKFIHEINGMFILIIYDKKEKKVISVRDNSGQKPLYYFFDNKNLILSSEISPILNSVRDKTSVNIDFNYHLRFISNIGEKTIYKNIFKLLPGQKIEFDLNNNHLTKNFFKHNLNNDQLSTPELIKKTVHDHLQTNRKIIINLSGGIDSNIILHESLHDNSLEALSTRFETDKSEYNEDFFIAKKICKNKGIKFHENLITKNNFINSFVKSFENLEEINGNINNPTYFLTYKYIKENGFRTVLSGDGGDEIFIGYNWFFPNNFLRFRYLPLLKNIFYNNSTFLKTHFYFSKNFGRYDSFKNLRNYINFSKEDKKFEFINKASKFFNKFVKINYKNQKKNLEISNLLHNQLFWLSEEIFNRTDKLAMYHSIESRSPFADYNLRVNIMGKLGKKEFYSKENKIIVRNIYKNKLDKDVFKRKKGWTTPRDWLLDKKFLEIILDLLPNKEIYRIKWGNIKNDLHKDKYLIMNRSLYPIISLAIILNKNNFFIK